MVVNALWAAGAVFFSQRPAHPGPDTFIADRGLGHSGQRHPRVLSYEITAIGDSNALSVALVRGATGDYLSAAQSASG